MQNTKEKHYWNEIVYSFHKNKIITRFWSPVCFDCEQHKCDPQINNTRQLNAYLGVTKSWCKAWKSQDIF